MMWVMIKGIPTCVSYVLWDYYGMGRTCKGTVYVDGHCVWVFEGL